MSLLALFCVPIYEYRCPNGHTFEVIQRMSDAPVASCELCGAAPVEKVLFPVAVHFKGSGFYATDYGRGSRKTTKEGESGSASTDGAGKKETPAAAEPKKGSDAKASDT